MRGPYAVLFLFLLAIASGCTPLKDRGDYWVDESYSAIGSEPRIQSLIFHYTAENFPVSLRELTGERVSSHYLIDSEPQTIGGKPTVFKLVPESQKAWHAGASFWRGQYRLNDTSIGIEIVNWGFRDEPNVERWQPYSESQIELLIAMSKDIIARYNIRPENVLGHSDVSPQRKVDPGPLFPWERLAQAGIGAWPNADDVARRLSVRREREAVNLEELQTNLKRYGYEIDVSGRMDAQTRSVVKAFQMHFRPSNYDGVPDAETMAILDALLMKYHDGF
ncbi:N-acetylmuramoyl-L-alanine amidase [Leminorella grimontii]|uniref:N-acetylmuramoyl-L-alanine amidase n=1 Tax=Leminorella grimontii TaxID=82981 RepID=UPI0020884E20|nr:N-acetylmuramoyl-L-alanine amidase [Leminorella grimontii]GKX59140.1 N-acetylmuramoyl-L-alanine amidase [Leminorella grimontii]